MEQNMLVMNDMLKDLEVKDQDVRNLLSNGSAKFYIKIIYYIIPLQLIYYV